MINNYVSNYQLKNDNIQLNNNPLLANKLKKKLILAALSMGIVVGISGVYDINAYAALPKSQDTSTTTVAGQQNKTDNYSEIHGNPFVQLSQEMDKLWNRFTIRHNGFIFDSPIVITSSLNSYLDTNDKQYTLNIEIPGFDKEQIKIELQGDYLVITAQKAQNEQAKDDNKYSDQQARNMFYQKLFLPKDIDRNNISSNLKNGVLTVILPRSPIKVEDVKTIPIN
ncbi:Hsp20/alpha crystallin family protein [Candidatus Tisiphia endosymbiont of Hybos culiciformis]|uniref:Hsp20/alpha crystallin family protein n=1 Tax=Candidatus Tisiphia endosymbiont of Hybos culiciformis TaxID=3139331 RepID=UPI003CCB106A